MYENIDVINDAESRAISMLIQERSQYNKFFIEAEKFIHDKNIIIGGVAGNKLLTIGSETIKNSPCDLLEMYKYDLYSDKAFQFAKELADKLYDLEPDGLGQYVSVLTKIPNYMFIISVNGRELFSMISLPYHKGIKIVDVVLISTVKSFFNKDLLLNVIGSEIQLISVYSDMCNPSLASKWIKTFEQENKLRDVFIDDISRKINNISEKADTTGGGKYPDKKKFIISVFNKFIMNSDRVIIGQIPIKLLDQNLLSIGQSRLQIITPSLLEDDATELVDIADTVGITIQWNISDPKLPIEIRLRRLTIFLVVDKTRREPIIDIYNSAQYDLMPYTCYDKLHEIDGNVSKGSIKIGTLSLLAKYRLIDIWIIQVLMKMQSIGISFGKRVMIEILEDYKKIIKMMNDSDKQMKMLFSLNSYSGRSEKLPIFLNRESFKNLNIRHKSSYYPVLSKNKKGNDQ
jgi:hypothetical protein